MHLTHCLLILFISLPASLGYRAVWQFRSMIRCNVPDSWPVLDYTDYGCYCGLGGSGTPVDELDRNPLHNNTNYLTDRGSSRPTTPVFCKMLSPCYHDAMQHDDCWPILDNPYTELYSYGCDKARRTVTCLNDNKPCEKFICECDRKAAMCFAKAGYKEGNAHLPASHRK